MAKIQYFDFEWQRPKVVLQLSPLDARQILDHPRGHWSASDGTPIADAIDVQSGLLLLPSSTEWETVRLMDSKNVIENFIIRNPSIRQIRHLIKKFGRMKNNGRVEDELELTQTRVSVAQTLEDSYVVESAGIWIENISLIYAANRVYIYKLGMLSTEEFIYDISSIQNKVFQDHFLKRAALKTSADRMKILTDSKKSTKEQDDVLQEIYVSVYEDILNTKLSNIDISITLSFGKEGKVQTHMKPKNLEDALWLAFAQYVSGATELRQCIRCEKVYPHRGHKDRQYCGGACRQAASRARRGL
ncbi:hypothetical protein ACFP9V_03900 [Deinococcus radiopugnans]|uniref:Uncharacterized protein n=1 Tax=Deinococcus radiopugnans ATCC 19172 TaxID=585398 RepID=A0A5C4Y8Y8_9DEIO|nr:hypothetical protein [Deinococcus radiopugnans]MBB6016935.1 hypothetical protein [Deinococcus radiopugnans ATCC 19172]TNM71487.1 hypothetical protein FHR04_08020 [Deinococcus radiopugnans ATCC 19172]